MKDKQTDDISKLGIELTYQGQKYPVKDLWWEGGDLHLIIERGGGGEREMVLQKAEITASHNPLSGEPVEPIERLSLPPKLPPWPMERCSMIDPDTGKWFILGNEPTKQPDKPAAENEPSNEKERES